MDENVLSLTISGSEKISLASFSQTEFLAQNGHRGGKIPYSQVSLLQVVQQLAQVLLSEVAPGRDLKATIEALRPIKWIKAEIEIAQGV